MLIGWERSWGHSFSALLQGEGRDLSGENVTAEDIRKNLTDYEFSKIYEMSEDKNLYQNLIDSLFPTIHGE